MTSLELKYGPWDINETFSHIVYDVDKHMSMFMIFTNEIVAKREMREG